MHNGILRLGAQPSSIQRNRSSKRLAKCKGSAALRHPALKRIANTRRLIRLLRCAISRNKGRHNISSSRLYVYTFLVNDRTSIINDIALRIVGNPVTGTNLRIQGDIAIGRHNSIDLISKAGIGIPTNDGLFGTNIKDDIIAADSTVFNVINCILSFNDAAGSIQEEDIVNLLELRRQSNFIALSNTLDTKTVKLDISIGIPAQELIAFLFGRLRRIQLFPITHYLSNGIYAITRKRVSDVGRFIHR